MGRKTDITGQKFGRLTAIKLDRIEHKISGGTSHYWLFKCDCGNYIKRLKSSVTTGHTQSCGCYHKERAKEANITHGLRKTKLYKKWLDIKKRCYNSKSQYYYCYGGRGIKVCDEWLKDFSNFYNWAVANGYDESSKVYQCTIDRIDVNGNYEPSNCRWVNQKVQNRNSRHCHYITYNNETHCLTEWAEITNISADKIRNRLKRNWSIEKALNTP